MRRFAPLFVVALLIAAAAVGWFLYSSYAAVQPGAGGDPAIERR